MITTSRSRRDADATMPVSLVPSDARSRRDADATVPVKTTFLRGGEGSAVHDHGAGTHWTHVVSGELVEDRWSRRPSGGWMHERRALRTGQAMAAAGDALHRVRARLDTVFVTTCACGCLDADAVDARTHAAVREASSELEIGQATLAGELAPT